MSTAVLAAASIVSLLVLLCLICLARALATEKAPRQGESLGEADLAEAAGVEDALAALLKRATVSSYDRSVEDDAAFEALKKDLELLFPRVHAAMNPRRVGDRALLFCWKGRDPSLEAAILCAHFDVVPAPDADAWRHPPFSGDIAEGFVWGRGAQDIKLMLVSSLHAAERLIAAGYTPRRTIYFAFGGDEEIGGERGARLIGETLAAEGVQAAFLLDEGGPVAEGMLSFVDRPLALVGIAEKGYMDAQIEALSSGGHASMPPRRSASGNLSRTVAAIEDHPSKARLGYTVRSFLARVSVYSPFAYRFLFRNLWLFGPLVKKVFSLSPPTSAMIRTTYAPTMLSGSPKENVLAQSATAIINVRILPGESSGEVLKRFSAIARRFDATVSLPHPEAVVEPLPESSIDGEGYAALVEALGQAFPEANAVPFLFSAGTDTKHYRKVAKAMYRLTPVLQNDKDLEGIHGRDERIAVSNLRRCEIFYKNLLTRL